MRVKNLFVLIVAIFSAAIFFLPAATSASDPGTGDWPMWGGTPDRNMVSNMKGLPTTWDVKTKKNVKWVAQLGSQTFGNVVVSGGMVFIGTNNEGLRDPKVTGDKGVLMAFRESDGEFMWQSVHDKLATGRVNDWPYQGIASSPLVDGNRVYYVSNRAELMCLDINGFRDGKNDGVQDEKLTGPKDADVIWRFDMMDEVGSLPHNLANSSPVIYGDLIFVSTSNGQDESHVNIPSPKAPAIIAVNKNTGNSFGKTTRSVIVFCTASGRHRRSGQSAACSNSCMARATAGFAVTKRSPARSFGSLIQTRKTPSGPRPV